jgi:hypothetical protein
MIKDVNKKIVSIFYSDKIGVVNVITCEKGVKYIYLI